MKKLSTLFLFLSFTLACSGTGKHLQSAKVPAGYAQLENELQWFTDGKNKDGQVINYCGQLETNNKLRLTASNGYFTHGVQAAGESKLPFCKTKFIAHNYEYLHRWTLPEHSLRWHIFFENSGSVAFNIELSVETSGSIIKATLNNKSTTFVTDKNKKSYRITLPVSKTGKNTFSLSIEKLAGRSVGKVYGIDLFGETVEDAKLLRARWRSGAVHTNFSSSKAEKTQLWVMSSKSLTPYSSYSPIVTPFGYYGTSFLADGRTGESMNFSMWSSSKAPMEQMAHLLALGSPLADFSGFGHEGTGVKPRGDWKPLASRPKVLTQALRVTYEGEYAAYYGYFLNPETENWQLFCAGRKWTPPDAFPTGRPVGKGPSGSSPEC